MTRARICSTGQGRAHPSPLPSATKFLADKTVMFRQQSLYLDVGRMRGQGLYGASGDLVVETTATSRDRILPL